MILDRLFRPKAIQAAGRALYAAAVEQARRPELYAELGVPDTVEGRFEAYTLHVVLLLDRLRGHGGQAGETAQALFDTYVKSLDDALREMGVGDLSVGKKMRRLGEAFYGRARNYEAAFAALPDDAALNALLERTVYQGADAGPAPRLAAYVLEHRTALAKASLDDLMAGRPSWASA
jgi:cytochrome b pre-mRNA-processing protein 3